MKLASIAKYIGISTETLDVQLLTGAELRELARSLRDEAERLSLASKALRFSSRRLIAASKLAERSK